MGNNTHTLIQTKTIQQKNITNEQKQQTEQHKNTTNIQKQTNQ